MNLLYILVLALLTGASFAQPLQVEVLDNCGSVIDLAPGANGYIVIEDNGTQSIDCQMSIRCADDSTISTRFLEIQFPSCDQSELKLISVLGPEEYDQYAVFESQPHFCGAKQGLISNIVNFEQYGEKEWKVSQKTTPKGIYSHALFSFSVHLPKQAPQWPPNELPQIQDKTEPPADTTAHTTTSPATAPTTTPPSTFPSTTPPKITPSTTTPTKPLTTTAKTPSTFPSTTPSTTTQMKPTTTPATTPPTIPTTQSTKPITVTVTKPKTSTPMLSSTAPPIPVYTCSCPVSIENGRQIGDQQQAAPRVYLDEQSRLVFNITASGGDVKCSDKEITSQCKSQCQVIAWKYVRRYGANKLVEISGSIKMLGDAVCQQTGDWSNADLTVHSQVLECPAVAMSSSVMVAQKGFYCFKGSYCSSEVARSFPLNSGSLHCRDIINSLTTGVVSDAQDKHRCTCDVGLSALRTVELTMTIPPTYMAASCRMSNSLCQEYCRTEAGKKGISRLGNVADITEEIFENGEITPTYTQIHDLLCKRLGLRPLTFTSSYLFSQVQGCDEYNRVSSTEKITTEIMTLKSPSFC